MRQQVSVFMQRTEGQTGRMVMLGNTTRILHPITEQFQPAAFIEAAKFANALGIQPTRMCLMRAASNVDSDGFRAVANWHPTESYEYIAADAIHIQEAGTMTMFQSADCPSCVVVKRDSNESILFHCGRPAGMPVDSQNIITDVLERIAPNDELDALEVIVTGSICGAHFPHQDGLGREQADAYLDEFGPAVFHEVETRSLDMKQVIRIVCISAGLEPHQIKFFGPDCTFADPCCASHRKDALAGNSRQTANSIIWVTL